MDSLTNLNAVIQCYVFLDRLFGRQQNSTLAIILGCMTLFLWVL